MEKQITIASAPINWGVSQVEDGNPPPERMLDAIVEAGYQGCELGPFGYFGKTPKQVLERFESRGLPLVTTWHSVDLAKPLSQRDTTGLRTLGKILQAGGCSVILISDAITDERLAVTARVEEHPETWWSERDLLQVRQTLLDIAEIARDYGLDVAVHPHIGGHIESEREIRQVLDATSGDPIGLCLDTGHIRLGGGDPIALLERDGARLLHVHAKDVDGALLQALQTGTTDYFTAVGDGLYAELGTGIIDWDGFKRGLERWQYAGWVVAEQDRLLVPGDERPDESNRRNRVFLRNLLGR